MKKMKQDATLLLADDDEAVIAALETLLAAAGNYRMTSVASGAAALERLQANDVDVALIDLTFDDLNGLEILERARSMGLKTEIILITGHGSIDTAVEAMRLGAFDYLTKPVDSRELRRILQHAIEKHQLVQSNYTLRQQLATLSRYQNLVGKSAPMQRLYALIDAAAPTEVSVLITGESGTGKELVARALHDQSKRADGPFLALNCAALPGNILESELFGHEKGAFTGAVRDKPGYFEQADGGTLFLDELVEMPIELQAKLLRVLETQRFRRVGGSKELQVDVRLLAATNKDPRQAVKDKLLREDLYYRLAVMEIELPALRDRREDIPLLVNEFLQKFAAAAGKKIAGLNPAAMQVLMAYDWPGNIRELRNAIERAVVLCPGGELTPGHLPPRLVTLAGQALPAAKIAADLIIPAGASIAEAERLLITKTLSECGNNKTRAAEVLGISLKTLHNKLGRYRRDGQ